MAHPRTTQDRAEQVLITLDDTALLAKAQAAKNSAKFTRLWDGDTSMHNGDDSSADMALCCQLAFWTRDPVQLDRLFRRSGLMRTKWDAKRGDGTYGERTIDAALAHQTEHYSVAGAIAPGGMARSQSLPGRPSCWPLQRVDRSRVLAI